MNRDYLIQNIWTRYIKKYKYSQIPEYVERYNLIITFYDIVSSFTYTKIKNMVKDTKEVEKLILDYKLKLVDDEMNKIVFLEFLNKFISHIK